MLHPPPITACFPKLQFPYPPPVKLKQQVEQFKHPPTIEEYPLVTQLVFPPPIKLSDPPAQFPVPVPTKITILPKKRVQKITILGKTVKKPVSDVKEKSVPVSAPVKQKIVLPITVKKTRKQYKERKLRIDL